MCHYCHKLGHNPKAAQHRSENCTDKNNTFSKNYVKTSTASNHYCRTCHKITYHVLHQNNHHEKPWFRCMVHT